MDSKIKKRKYSNRNSVNKGGRKNRGKKMKIKYFVFF